MKAMILAAGVGSRLMPLTLTIPKPMLPIVNKPALEHIVNLCKNHGVKQIKMNLHYLPEQIDSFFKDGEDYGIDISYSIEKKLLGTAGGIKRIQSFFDETFIVLSGDGFTNIDLTDMYKFHKSSKSTATIAVKEVEDTSKFGVVVTDENNSIQKFQEKPKKEDALSNLANLGIYIFEPDLLEKIPPKQEYDFGYNLFPVLLKDKTPFFAYKTNAYWSDIGSLEEYWKVNLDIISGKVDGCFEDINKIKDGFYVHPSSKVDKKVIDNAVTPVLIGKNVQVSSGVDFYGPVIVGDDVFIENKAIIDKSVILKNTYIGKSVELKESVVSQNYHMSVKNKFGTYVDDDQVLKSHFIIPYKTKLNQFLINATDRIVSFFLLLLLSPLFLIVAILIKLDSKGPVFYISKRLKAPQIEKKGNHWYVFFKEKPVKYYVFRTMYTDTDKRVKELKNIYESGPFVKIEDDPRVTKVGNILRKTSIDELPLLWNVLKGNMSLVGIWALPTYEAEHLQHKGLKSDNEDSKIDLTDVAQERFKGRLGLAGYWQARGRSKLSAEERALHDTMQSVLSNISDEDKEYLGEYAEFHSYKGYIKMMAETFKSVVKREGAI